RDISGFYFVRLSHSVSPGQHILLSFDIEETGEDVYTIVVQPLLTDIGQDKEPREDAREPVGDAIIVEGLAPDEDGVFQLSLEEVTVDGQANSVTWSDILADMDLTITPCEDEENDIICGEG